MRCARVVTVAAASVAVLGTFGPAPATASGSSTLLTASQALAQLNAQRHANGIPGDVTLNSTWSTDCAAHNNWEAANKTIQHPEDAGSPKYSTGGNFAGTHGVLAYNSPWFMGSPWESAPLHLEQLLRPQLTVTGISELELAPIDSSYAGQKSLYECAVTLAGYQRAAPDTDQFYSYPGDGTTYPFAETAREVPNTPGQAVGIRQGTVTGPNILVFWDGPSRGSADALVDLVAATVTGPAGAVATKFVSDDTSGFTGALPLASDGVVIPVHPLTPSTHYTVSYRFASRDRQRSLSHSISFTTSALPTLRKSVRVLSIDSETHQGHRSIAVRLSTRWPFVERTATLHRDLYSKTRRVASDNLGPLPLLPACDKVWLYKIQKGLGVRIKGTFYPITSVRLRVTVSKFALGSTTIPAQARAWTIPGVVSSNA